MTKNLRKLLLEDLQRGIGEITPVLGAAFAEAGAVCLDDQGHINGVKLKVNGHLTEYFSLYWQIVTDKMRRSWNDEEVTTENGAYAIACLLVRDLTPYTVIERAKKGPGFDFWLGKKTDFLFQNKARLEVSGIRRGSNNEIKGRVNKKVNQVKPSHLPAYIIVIEFSNPLSNMVKI